jgi:thioredoxin-like negative regulator of GroEL
MDANPARKDVIIAQLDGNLERAVRQRYGVQNYPSILIFKKGGIFPAERYNSQRTFEAFREWIERVGGPEEKAAEAQEKKVLEVKKIEKNGDVDDHIHQIYERIDDLGKSISTGHGGKEHNELKDILAEMNSKIDKKMSSPSADINFSQGIGFLIFGALIGVGISFTYINYQKLGRKRLAD